MTHSIARLLRRWADRIDPPPCDFSIMGIDGHRYYSIEAAVAAANRTMLRSYGYSDAQPYFDQAAAVHQSSAEPHADPLSQIHPREATA